MLHKSIKEPHVVLLCFLLFKNLVPLWQLDHAVPYCHDVGGDNWSVLSRLTQNFPVSQRCHLVEQNMATMIVQLYTSNLFNILPDIIKLCCLSIRFALWKTLFILQHIFPTASSLSFFHFSAVCSVLSCRGILVQSRSLSRWNKSPPAFFRHTKQSLLSQ